MPTPEPDIESLVGGLDDLACAWPYHDADPRHHGGRAVGYVRLNHGHLLVSPVPDGSVFPVCFPFILWALTRQHLHVSCQRCKHEALFSEWLEYKGRVP